MTHTRPHRTSRRLTAAAILAGSLALAGCSFTAGDPSAPAASGSATSSGSASGTTCNLTGCTVVLQRGVDARASVLGIEVELVGVTGDQVSLRVAGQQVSVPLNGEGQASVAGFSVSVQSANDSQIVLRISTGG